MPQASLHPKLLEAVRMVLSGIARTQARFPCGKNLIAQMLCGSRSTRMKTLGLSRLSTFGLLGHLTQPEVAVLIESLIAAGCAEQVEIERHRPVVQLTELGRDVMQAKVEPDAGLPVPSDLLAKIRGDPPVVAQEEPETQPLPPADSDLLGALKAWRAECADRSGVPFHYVLSNRTLEELARRPPTSREALLAVHGIGPAKVKSYGDELLALIARSSAPEVDRDRRAEREPAGREASHPSHYWTWRLLSAGFSAEECAAIRGLKRQVILSHALEAAESGWEVRAQWCLAPELLAALEAAAAGNRAQPVGALLSRLPPGTHPEEVELFFRCRRAASQ
jgi:ATP-dependent DNA helicase RecQ